MSLIATIIIPTHNRSALLKKLLESLSLQSSPPEKFEVIVIADGCKDDTADMVKNYEAAYLLSLFELPGLGAASARNKGATLAKGSYLIFLDDDMEPSVDFIDQHIAAHRNENSVIIGYSPLGLNPKASIQRLALREWWEEKFQAMRNRHHRFKFNDLTSGNFSISLAFFNRVNGFNTTLLCREDYELGFRLIKAGAEFCFAYKAKALHLDDVTDLKRSLHRKKSEGIADIQIKNIHPDFINNEAFYYLSQRSVSKKILLKAVEYIPSLTDSVVTLSELLMDYFEKFKMWSSWGTMNYRLHQYWYLRGLMTGAKSSKQLYWFILNNKVVLSEKQKLSINLCKGLQNAEEEVDRLKPLSVDIYYGEKLIGNIAYEPGAEPIKGVHVRKILKDRFSNELASVLFPEKFAEL